MTNKELQALLTRFPDDVEVVFQVMEMKTNNVYASVEEDNIKLRRLVADKSKKWYIYHEKGRNVVLTIGDTK